MQAISLLGPGVQIPRTSFGTVGVDFFVAFGERHRGSNLLQQRANRQYFRYFAYLEIELKMGRDSLLAHAFSFAL